MGTSYIHAGGYRVVHVGKARSSSGYMLEHRLVMEQVLGRALRSDEHVHHIDGDKLNNDPSNLVLLTNAEHQRLHDWPVTKSQRASLKCEHCGKDYQKKRGRVSESKYCSNKCRLDAMHEKAKAYHAERRPAALVCQYCGKSYQVPQYRISDSRFCSKACHSASMRMAVPEKCCEVCGKAYTPRPDAAESSRFCSIPCRGVGMADDWRGAKNPRRHSA